MNNLEIEDFNEKHTDDKNGGTLTGRNTKDPDQKKSEALTEVISWVVTVGAAVLLALLIKNFLIINADVPTGSMENTIMPGDRFIGSRITYHIVYPQRGDIVVFKYPDDESQVFVKRIIGLPGETVKIEDGKIYINGSEEPLQEDYLKEEWTVATGPYTFEVPEDSYLVMGDNRNDSWDARYWTNTYVSRKKILGKASMIYWPFSHAGLLK